MGFWLCFRVVVQTKLWDLKRWVREKKVWVEFLCVCWGLELSLCSKYQTLLYVFLVNFLEEKKCVWYVSFCIKQKQSKYFPLKKSTEKYYCCAFEYSNNTTKIVSVFLVPNRGKAEKEPDLRKRNSGSES